MNFHFYTKILNIIFIILMEIEGSPEKILRWEREVLRVLEYARRPTSPWLN